jgi:hypothetical protein
MKNLIISENLRDTIKNVLLNVQLNNHSFREIYQLISVLETLQEVPTNPEKHEEKENGNT